MFTSIWIRSELMPMNSSILLALNGKSIFLEVAEWNRKEGITRCPFHRNSWSPPNRQSCFVTDHASRQHLVSSSLFFRSGTPFDPVFSIVEKGAERETLGYQSGGGIWDAGKLIYLRGRPDIRFVELRFKSACRRSGR